MVLCLVPLLRQALMACRPRPESIFLTQIIICPTGVGVEQVVVVVVVAAAAAVAAAAVAVVVVMEGVGLSDSSLSIMGRTAS